MKKLQTLLVILLAAGLISCSQEKSNELESDKFESEITAIENGLILPIIVKSDSLKTFNISERMEYHKVPGMSIALVKEGELRWAKGYGIANTETGTPVTESTMFQAGSISKPIAALAALKLMEEGKLDLDEDVNQYLTEWKVPENRFTGEEKVTIRRLLTHTAGMTVHGFPGYSQTDTFPSINTVLNGEGNTAKIVVDTFPDAIWRYSGGGYTVMEKAVEDISGMPLEEYMAKNIFPELDMLNSTYEQPISAPYQKNVSSAYDSKGELYEGHWHNYPEQAAAGLWTTPTNLAKYCMAVQDINMNQKDGFLSYETISKMLTKHKNDWGLGPSLVWDGDSLRFQHGGKNAGFTNSMIAFANRGDAVIVMTSADNGMNLIQEVLRSVSKYYDWGIYNPREVEIIDIEETQLDQFIGKYVLDFQVDGIGDYFITVEKIENGLKVYDPNNDEENRLYPISDSTYIDLISGDEIAISQTSDSTSLVWNDQYTFNMIKE